MSFTSFSFLFIYFPLSLLGYFIIRGIEKKCKKENLRLCDIYLVLVSIAFYGWALTFGMVYLCIYIVIVYIMGRAVCVRKEGQNKNKLVAGAAISVLTAILFFCKYFNFILESLNEAFQTGFDAFYIIVPLGISFITFSGISYVIDVYRDDKIAGNLLDVALYLTFFPKVVSGPIVLWKDFRVQSKLRKIDDVRMMNSLNRMMIGYMKKVILADTFGDVVYNIQRFHGTGTDMPTAWACALLYFLEIYYDFSGYSDIALGVAGLFGFEFKENFNFPYVSSSISEFWRRWHISLGAWFREYIYFPLGGSRKGMRRTLINLFIVFLLTGIWHGAGWNYILWGVLNGICVVLERCVQNKRFYINLPYIIKWAFTMMIVLVSWLVFMSPDLDTAAEFIKIMFGAKSYGFINFTYEYFFTAKNILLVVIGLMGATVLHCRCFRKLAEKINETKSLFVIQELLLFGGMALAVMFMVNSSYSPFIYFQY